MSLYDLHTNSESLYGYRDRWKIPEIAYTMAIQNPEVINPKLERVIMRSPKWAYQYVIHNRKRKRWLAAERYITQDPRYACLYAIDVLRKRWADIGKPKVEDIIMKNPEWAYEYARLILNKPWSHPDINKPEAEDIIMKNPEWAFWYAHFILNGQRWPAAERYIMSESRAAYWYALHILKGRWADIGKPEAEDTIKKNPNLWKDYKRNFGIYS